MKSYRYDIHIHSALSPCADILLSPNNILNYATLQKLDIIAVTDHNSMLQQNTLDILQKSYDLLYIYGVEVTTTEGFHVLCYFKTKSDADQMNQLLLQQRSKNSTTNEQLIFDEHDAVVCTYPYNLLDDSLWTIDSLYQLVQKQKGLFCLAHIDRYKTEKIEKITNIRSIFHAIEVTNQNQVEIIQKQYPVFLECKFIVNSDAHDLVQIGKHQAKIKLKEKSLEAFFQYFREDKYD